ncbi:MAG: DUF748 domain-containing protein [Deltaproteobacteria bacterium]|nr:DUF748 domain-containing protein [Deltaproteobacteria bacterium]
MKLFKKIFVSLIVFLVFIGVVGFFILPAALKPVLIKKISLALHRETSIEQIRINPFALSATIRGLKLGDPGLSTPFVAFDELYANVDTITSIFRRALILEEIRLDHPTVGLIRKEDGSYNFSDLIPKEDEGKKEPAAPFLFSINNIQIIKGKIHFRDMPNQTDHTVDELQLAIPFISNIEHYLKKYVEPKFSAVINGHAVTIAGRTQPFLSSRATSFDIDINDMDIPHYLQYVPVQMNFKLISARLDSHLTIQFLMHSDQSPRLQITGNASLRKVILDDLQGNKVLRLPALTVQLASLEPLIPKVHLAQIALDAPELVIRRDKQGELTLLNLIQPDKKDDKRQPPERQDKKEDHAKKKSEFSLLIDDFRIDKADVTFIDVQPVLPVQIRIHPLRLYASKLSMKKGDRAAVDLALTVDKKTDITAKGSLGIQPLNADLALDVKNLAIRPFQPYFTECVQLDVTRGSVSTAGALSLTLDEESKTRVAYQGNLSVSQLATVDRAHRHDFLKFKQLGVLSLSAGYNPLFAHIKDISLNDFFAKIVINEGGSTNIQDIFSAARKDPDRRETPPDKQPPQPLQSENTAQTPPDIKIGKVRFQGGTVDFTDRNIKPNYAATMLNLKGSITGLSSQEISRASVDIKGNLGYGSPIEISGSVNPLIKDLFADIKLSFKDIEMSPVTPYTSRYLGYPITKGKLNFAVSYLVEKRKLHADNKVFFDQLTFGDKVESPEAINAPVTLAVTLLTDRNGQINLDIPVSGSLDDPQFKIWPIVWQILVNLITKAVTSPFLLLSSLTGAGEEMSFIEFDFGSAQLPETGQNKISALAKALYDRPHLKLDIEAYVDPAHDTEALKKAEFNRLLKVQKLKDMVDKGQVPGPLEDIQINQQEYEKYLTLAYKAADFPKPRTVIGFLKSLPPPEMEKLINDHISITDSDLIQLAAGRAQTVRERLLQAGIIEATRIYIVKAKSLRPEKNEKLKDSRVEFKLK